MSIRDNMIQQVLGNPGKYSIQQLEAAMKSGSLPAYVVVPIIQDKMQQQKQMQAAMAMQQQPPQSTVAQQVMQEAGQMGGGVEQLPSNLPQEYAGGGIVAFEDGGMVGRYDEGGVAGFAEALQRQQDELGGYFGGYGEEAPKKRRWNPFTNSYEPMTPEQEAKLAAGEAEMRRYYGVTPKTVAPEQPSVQGRPDMMRGNRAMTGVPPAAVGPGAGIAGAGGLGGGNIGGIFEQLRKAQEAAYPEGKSVREELEPLLKGFVERSTAREAARKAEAAALRGEVKGQAYEGLEADLKKEAEQMGADKEQAKAMAIFKAGLAMMAGTSRNALQNIGAGAMVGAEDYQRAAADMKKAQKENQRMMAHIEQARRAEQRGDIDKRVEELGKASDREEKRDEFFVSSLGNAGIKDKEQRRQLAQNLTTVAGGIYGHQLSGQYQLAAAERRAEGRGEMSEYQTQQLLSKARQEYTLDMARAELAKRQKLSKTPKLGEDTDFDDKARKLHKMYVYELAGVPMPEDTATVGQPVNYSAMGYRVTGQSR